MAAGDRRLTAALDVTRAPVKSVGRTAAMYRFGPPWSMASSDCGPNVFRQNSIWKYPMPGGAWL